MLLMLTLCQSSCPGLAAQIRLHVVQQLVDLDGVGLEGDLVAVAEAVFDGGVLAGGLVADGSKRPQLPTIWSRAFWR